MTTEIAAAAEQPIPLAAADLSRIAQDLQIRRAQVEHVVQLLDGGNTIPFITRYRKDVTGGLNESALRLIHDRVKHIRGFADRKQTILKSIEAQGKLTDKLKAAIIAADFPRRLEDLYQPFKPKKKSLAGEARDRGLEPLALAIWNNDPVAVNLDDVLAGMVNPEKQINTAEEAKLGTKNIIIEMIAEIADMRGAIRRALWDIAKIAANKHEKLHDGKGLEYKDFFQYSESVQRVPAHRILALNRGERENALAIRFDYDRDIVRKVAIDNVPNWAEHSHREILESCLDEALSKIVLPVLERELRRELTEVAQHHAIEVFARNLRGLLMQPPQRGKRVLAIDPGFRPGCRLVALDEHGTPLEDSVMFPHMPQKHRAEGKLIVEKFIRKHQPNIIAIGNGSACRETEELVAEVINICDRRRRGEPVEEVSEQPSAVSSPLEKPVDPNVVTAPTVATFIAAAPEAAAQTAETPAGESPPVVGVVTTETAPATPPAPPGPSEIEKLRSEIENLPHGPANLVYAIVNEAGASDYSASPVGREEFPQFDTSLRGTISIGRRLQDPLGELVKIDPQHVGVGLYQHDVHGKHLKGALESVVESCVNHVGVDVNTASVPLLRYVAGFNQVVAREVVEHRQKNGAFRTLEQLIAIPSIGSERFAQAVGFLKIGDGDEPLDVTTIHPENYAVARKILEELGFAPADLRDNAKLNEFREKLAPVRPDELAHKHGIIEPLVWELLDALTQPGRDPRDDLPPPIFRHDVLKIEDMKAGMELKGTVLNVVDFGAFVDVGLKDSGLVHISQLANRYVRNPHELVAVGDVVTVWVMAVESERRRVSLTMIPPGTVRKEEEPPARSFGPRGERQRQPQHDEHHGHQGRPPRQGGQRRQQQRRQPRDENVEIAAMDGPAQPRNTARFERKPPRPPKPLPTLTKEKKEGKAYLNTLGELEAFFKQRDGDAPPTGA
jgi:protein Tex